MCEVFCDKYVIEIPNLDDIHSATRFGYSHQVTIEYYFRVEIFSLSLTNSYKS